ncbi:hypothetical protein FACS1894155_07330 [Bacteroidia bacterium]|nr:hypothetical protein FACS189455_2050 [Bacteroidia bacterium]GHU89803.1 hypothetical protein FACS1894155_07330 [Bacteroidia bacterium]
MNKKVVFALMSLLLGFPLFSQVTISLDSLSPPQKPFKTEWSFGANGGITLSKISFNPIIKQDMLLQYAGGLTARYISEKNVGIQVELNYSLRGWKEKHDSINIYKTGFPISVPDDSMKLAKYSRSLSYLELPIMTHIYFDMSSRMRIIFLLGPQLGYYLSEKVIDSELTTGSSLSDPPYYELKVQRKFDYGLTGGMGFELRTGVGSFVIDGRYYFGLSDIFSNHKSDYFQASSNQVISVKLSYLFRK